MTSSEYSHHGDESFVDRIHVSRYLYTVTIAIDACFRLKRRDVSDETKDPILGSGWGYFVEDTGYHELLREYGDQEEVRSKPESTISNLTQCSLDVDL